MEYMYRILFKKWGNIYILPRKYEAVGRGLRVICKVYCQTSEAVGRRWRQYTNILADIRGRMTEDEGRYIIYGHSSLNNILIYTLKTQYIARYLCT